MRRRIRALRDRFVAGSADVDSLRDRVATLERQVDFLVGEVERLGGLVEDEHERAERTQSRMLNEQRALSSRLGAIEDSEVMTGGVAVPPAKGGRR